MKVFATEMTCKMQKVLHDTQQVLNKALVVITIIVVLQEIGGQFNSEQWKK